MTIRNPAAFALAVLCLLTSGALGVMVHDGEVGATALRDASPGDDVRFKADATDAGALTGFLDSWSAFGSAVDLLDADGLAVLVVHDGASLDDGAWIVAGTVSGVQSYLGTTFLVVRADSVTAPLLFA